MALQFPQLPSAPAPGQGDGLSDIMLKVAAEKRNREDLARRFLLDQTRMQHEQQRMDQQDRIQRVKDNQGFQKEGRAVLDQALPLLANGQADRARALIAAHNAPLGGLPEDMRRAARITLPPQGPPPVEPVEPTAPEAPTPGAPPVPYYTGHQGMPPPPPGMQPFSVDVDGRPIQSVTEAPLGRKRPDEQRYYEPHPEAPDPEGPLDLQPPPQSEGPLEAGEQAAIAPNLALEMYFDAAEKRRLEASNDQQQAEYSQAEAAKQSEFQRRREAFPGQMAAYQKQREAYENPSYEIGIGDQKVTYHRREIERAEAQKNAELAQRWGQAMMPAVGSDEMGRQFVGIAQAELSITGDAGKAAAAFNAFLGADIKSRAAMVEHAKKSARDAEMLQIAHQNANSKSRIATVAEQSFGLKEHEEPLKEATRAETSANGFLQKQGYTGKLTEARALADSMSNFVAHGGAALDTAAAVSFANRVQQKGLLTDKDFHLFWQSVGGPVERLGDTFQRMINGEMGEKRRQDAIKAMDQLAVNAQRSLSATAVGLHRYLSHYGGSDGERERIMESHFPRKDYGNAYPTEEEAAVAPDAAAAPPAQGARSPGADDITGAAKAHRNKLRPKAPPKKSPGPKVDWFAE